MSKQIGVSLSPKEQLVLKTACRLADNNVSFFIRKAIDYYIRKNHPEVIVKELGKS